MTFTICSISYADDFTPELREVDNSSMRRPHIGVNIGVGNPEGSRTPGGRYLVEVGLQPYVPFGLAVEGGYSYFTDGPDKVSRTSLLLKGTYNFGGTVPVLKYSYIGLGIGPAWEDSTHKDGFAALTVPQLGFDIPLETFVSKPLSIGLNASYNISSTGTRNVFYTSGVLKYWY